MQIDKTTDTAPGCVTATVRHGPHRRTLTFEVMPHPAGGYIAKLRGGDWCVRCLTVNSALLMAAAPCFPLRAEAEPWLTPAPTSAWQSGLRSVIAAEETV